MMLNSTCVLIVGGVLGKVSEKIVMDITFYIYFREWMKKFEKRNSLSYIFLALCCILYLVG